MGQPSEPWDSARHVGFGIGLDGDREFRSQDGELLALEIGEVLVTSDRMMLQLE